ncbi:MAG: hypothetical protein D4R43_03080 [Sphingobacteriales bacterium]|nr:MAG: hypothetical protein D4R43_03080 [Sphingobacteriales bacterium]
MKAFEANAIDYLLKPFSKERFDKALNKWMQQHDNAAPTKSAEELFKNILV